MKITRRGVLAGAAAVSTAGLAQWRWLQGSNAILLFDEKLSAGRRFAEAGRAAGERVRPLTGDRIRLARGVLESEPTLILGISRHADAMMIADVAREAGYVPAAEFAADKDRCTLDACNPAFAWNGRRVQGAEANWPEAFADWAAADSRPVSKTSKSDGMSDFGLVLGWVLQSRG